MIVLISGSAIYFNLLLNRHEVLFRSSYFSGFFYVLLSSAIPAFHSVHPIHFTNLFLLIVLDQGYRMYRESRPVGTLFNAGLLIGLCCLIYLPLVPMMFFCLLQISVLRSFSLREFLVLLVGLFIPAFYLSVIWFPDQLVVQVKSMYDSLSHFKPQFTLPRELPVQVMAGLLCVIQLFSMIRLRSNYYKNVVRMRDFQQVIFLLMFSSVAVLFCVGKVELIHYLVLVTPLSVFATYYFVSGRRFAWYYETLFWVLSSAVIWNQVI
ncbi:MAG: hypothetical protein ACKOA1_09005 [Bacteroidota bacterium]